MKENGRKQNGNMLTIFTYLLFSIQGSFHELILMGFQFSIWYKPFLTKLAFERLILFMNWFNVRLQCSFFWKCCLKKLANGWLILFMNWFNMGFQCSVCEKIFLHKIGIWEAYFLHELIQHRILMPYWLKILHFWSIKGHQVI